MTQTHSHHISEYPLSAGSSPRPGGEQSIREAYETYKNLYNWSQTFFETRRISSILDRFLEAFSQITNYWAAVLYLNDEDGALRLKEKRPDFKIFIGKSHFWTAGILSGADGALDGISNLIPGLCVQLYNTIEKGDAREAFQIQRKIDDIWEIYNCGSFLSGIKTALQFLGIGNGRVTAPIHEIPEEEKQKIRTILIKNGLIPTNE